MSAQISSDQAQQRTLLIQPSRQCVQRTTELVLRKNIEYCGLDGAFLTHCWLRWLRGVLLQWNDPKHTRNHRIRPVENQDSSILFNVLQVYGRTLAKWLNASQRKRPGIAAGPCLLLGSEQLDLEIHAAHTAHSAAALGHTAAAGVLLRQFGDHGLCGDQKRRYRSRVLDRHANHLGGVDDALGDQVDVFASLRVEAVGILVLFEDFAD